MGCTAPANTRYAVLVLKGLLTSMSILSELNDCFNKGLIRRIVPSKDRALRSLGKASRWLEEAKKSLGFSLFKAV